MISISHSPNSDRKQIKKAFSLLLPWNWKHRFERENVQALRQQFADYFGSTKDRVQAFSQGREALYAALKACGIGSDDEVIIQAYTCIVVPNSVSFNAAKPVYVDIDDTLNVDPTRVEKRITDETKAIIIQHTFGVPANIDAVRKICDKHGLYLIEDCAHSLGAKYEEKLVGSFGDIAIFSFGRDKIISSVSGGMGIVNNPDLADSFRSTIEHAPKRSAKWVRQNLLHPLLVPLLTALMGRLRIGQGLLMITQRLGLLNKVYKDREKRGEEPDNPVYQMPGAMAELALDQFKQLDDLNRIRTKHAQAYDKFVQEHGLQKQTVLNETTPVYLRYTILTNSRDTIMQQLQKQGILLGNWYKNPIMPEPDDLKKLHYQHGSCPKAEEAAKQSLNLPTHRHLTETTTNTLLEHLQNKL